MAIWRMAFRVGEGGPEMWELCLRYGVAAITYYPLRDTDLSSVPPEEPAAKWAKLSSPQRYSLKQVAYVMRKGDTIFAKQGPRIVGKGIVLGGYRFDTTERFKGESLFPWRHQIPVKWLMDFQPIRVKLGRQQRYTVERLRSASLRSPRRHQSPTRRTQDIEGELVRREMVFWKRNATLIAAKKATSDYRCEVCGFSFEAKYGKLAREFIIAHHMVPGSRRTRPAPTTLDDIALLCANCHSVIHLADPILTPAQLARRIRR